MRLHELRLLEFWESHISKVVDALSPRMPLRVVFYDSLQIFIEYFEPEIGFFVVERLKLPINLTANGLVERLGSCQKKPILIVKVMIGENA